MRGKVSGLVALWVLSGAAAWATEDEDGVLIWQGFTQEWGYNHRVARLGDWVSGGELHHSAATGTGPDRLEFQSSYALLRAPGLAWQSSVVELSLRGREGESLVERALLEVPASADMQEKGQVIALLAGFDLEAMSTADKLQAFRVSLGDARYDAESAVLRVEVEAGLAADCDSPECPRGEEGVDYQLRVHVTWLAADQELAWTAQSVSHTQRWGRWRPSEPTPIESVLQGIPGEFSGAVLAWRGISFSLDKPMHLQRLDSLLRPGAYDPALGRQSYVLDLGFVQWRRGMRWAHLPYSLFAYRAGGRASWSGEVVLLQAKGSSVESMQVSDVLDWPGGNEPASLPAALWVESAPKSRRP